MTNDQMMAIVERAEAAAAETSCPACPGGMRLEFLIWEIECGIAFCQRCAFFMYYVDATRRCHVPPASRLRDLMRSEWGQLVAHIHAEIVIGHSRPAPIKIHSSHGETLADVLEGRHGR